MSKPGIIYRIQQQYFHESVDVQTIVDLLDTETLIDDADDPEIRPLTSSGNPLELTVIDNDEDPLTSIRALQAIVRFNSDFNNNMSTFLGGGDQRWMVHAYIGTDDKTVFKGFLDKSQIGEPFMPYPNIVELQANDGIGLLKEIPLVNSSDENPKGIYALMKIIAMAMKKTGLDLEFRVAFNIKNADLVDDISVANSNDEHFFSNNFIDIRTVEKEISKSEDCYTVLKKIFGEEAFITQRQGKWWIIRIDEIEDPSRGLFISSFDSDGNFIANLGEKTFRKTIGRDQAISFINAITNVVSTLQHKFVEEVFNFETPIEIVPNIDFSRGELLQNVSPTEDKFKIESWQAGSIGATGNELYSAEPYIRKIYTAQGDISESYAVIPQDSDQNFIISEPIRVHEKDKFVIGVDRRLSIDVGGTGHVWDRHIQVRLYADDGTFYTHAGKSSAGADFFTAWVACTASFNTNQKHFVTEWDKDGNSATESANIYDGESAEIPKDGYIRIVLMASSESGASADTYYSNLTFEYQPYVAGSYRLYSGQSHKTSQAGNFRAKRENQVFISDSPKRLFKGGLLKIDSWSTVFSGAFNFLSGNSFEISGFHTLDYQVGQLVRFTGSTLNNIVTRITGITYHVVTSSTEIEVEDATVTEVIAAGTIQTPIFSLANEFYNAAVFPGGPPSVDYIHPYGQIQLFDVWNQFKNQKRVFQAVCQGCDVDTVDTDSQVNHTHLMHKWDFSDASQHTIHRFFQLLNFRQNWRTADMTGTFREVFNIDIAKDYSNHEFKYKPKQN